MKKSETEDVKVQVIAYSMLYLGLKEHKLNTGSMEYDNYQIALQIGEIYEKNGWLEEILDNDDIRSECIDDLVNKLIELN
jgi:hypothetical protein